MRTVVVLAAMVLSVRLVHAPSLLTDFHDDSPITHRLLQWQLLQQHLMSAAHAWSIDCGFEHQWRRCSLRWCCQSGWCVAASLLTEHCSGVFEVSMQQLLHRSVVCVASVHHVRDIAELQRWLAAVAGQHAAAAAAAAAA